MRTFLPIASRMYMWGHKFVQNKSCFFVFTKSVVFLLLQLLMTDSLIGVGLSQLLMESNYHGGADVRDLNMCIRTETHSLL